MYVLIFSALLVSSLASAKVIEKIVAIVNDDAITLTDLDEFRKKLKKGGLTDDALLKLTDQSKLLADQKALVDHIINEKIMDSSVRKNNLSITIEKVEQEIRNITRRNQISRTQLKSALKEKGIDFADYQDFIKTSLERQSLIEKEVSSKIKISDEDITSYYIQNTKKPDALVFNYSLAHIIFLNKNGGASEALRKAQRTLAKLKGGTEFSTLASQYSEDSNFSEGGLWADFTLEEMSSNMRKAILVLKVGGHTDLVESKVGYQIIKLNKKTLMTDPNLEKQKAEIRNLIFAKVFQKQFRDWLEQKRAESYVRIN